MHACNRSSSVRKSELESDVFRDMLRAIGNYHSRTPGLHDAYRDRVLAAAQRLANREAAKGEAAGAQFPSKGQFQSQGPFQSQR